jgi:hypothetical protein
MSTGGGFEGFEDFGRLLFCFGGEHKLVNMI